MSTVPVRKPRLKISTDPTRRQLEAVAVWVAWAKATLEAIEGMYANLAEAATDPGHPLYGNVTISGASLNLTDDGISRLDCITIPGLADTPNPLGGEKGGAA